MKCTCLQVIMVAVVLKFDVKGVKYQHNFAPLWRYDFIVPFFAILVMFRIVWGNNGAFDIFENLLF